MCKYLEMQYAGVISDALEFDLKVFPRVASVLFRGAPICGPAFTCKGASYTRETENDRFRVEMLADMQEGCIQVVDGSSCLVPEVAHYGDISASLAQFHGAKGALINGSSRDTEYMPMGFRVGSSEPPAILDAYGKWQLVESQVEVRYKNLTISPDDILYISEDGLIAFDSSYLEELVPLVKERSRKESLIRQRLAFAKTHQDILDIYDEEDRW